VRAERARWATARGARDQRWIRTRYLKYLGTKCSARKTDLPRFPYRSLKVKSDSHFKLKLPQPQVKLARLKVAATFDP